MAFGDVRKCPVCPAVWIEDNQMYEDPNVCPGCGVDAGDVMREFARGGPGNLSRELLLNPGLEYFFGQIDDGKTKTFENWENANFDDVAGNKIEAVSDCVEGGAAAKLVYTTNTPLLTQYLTDPISVYKGNFKLTYWTKGDGATGNIRARVTSVTGTPDTENLDAWSGVTGTIYQKMQYTFYLSTSSLYVRVRFSVSPGYAFVDGVSLKKIITD